MEIRQNVSLAEFTSWNIGGPAEYLVLPKTIEELRESLEWASHKKLAVTVMGGGSNVLISDLGIPGLTICLRKFSKIETRIQEGVIEIDCLSGTSKSELLKVFLKQSLSPALFLAGLPGDVGGGIVMNAGVAEALVPREFGELVDSFEVLLFRQGAFEIKKFKHKDIDWQYRHSTGWEPGIIVSAVLRWPLTPEPGILERVREANKIRLSKQPLDLPSCGSVFINPVGHKAAQLIESCGLKGFRMGDAQVSLKHANFIVNLNRATAIDTWNVILHVQSKVKDKTGVDLKTEVVRLGNWPASSS
jgi:UDP-N-acetylmuramate dehydrogenase